MIHVQLASRGHDGTHPTVETVWIGELPERPRPGDHILVRAGEEVWVPDRPARWYLDRAGVAVVEIAVERMVP